MNKKYFFYIYKAILILSLLIFQADKSFAGNDISVPQAGNPVKSGNITSQVVTLSLKTKQNWKLVATPMSNSIKNISFPSHELPFSRVVILDNDSGRSFQLEYGKPQEIMAGKDNLSVNKTITVRITNSDGDYPGTYNGTILLNLVSAGGSSSDSLDIKFNQPLIQNINLQQNNVNIDVVAENAMLNNYSQESSTPAKLYISSNKDWQLTLDRTETNNPLDYYFKVFTVSPDIKSNYTDYTKISDSSFVLAQGGPTVSAGNAIAPVMVQVNYMLKTSSNTLLPAGNYNCNVVFNLHEKSSQ